MPAAERLSGPVGPGPAWATAALLWAGLAWAGVVAPGWQVWLASAVLAWLLLTLALVDARVLRLPDVLTWSLTAAGLVVAALISQRPWLEHLLGAALGYGVFAGVAWLYRRLRSREGLGLGDAKLLAAAGAWLSWRGLPSVVLLAAVAALLWLLVRRLAARGGPADDRLPFGPPLCLALWWTWLYGPVEGQFS